MFIVLSCVINIDEEHKNEEVDDYIEPPSKKRDKLDSKLQEEIRNRLLFIKKLIKSNQFGYV